MRRFLAPIKHMPILSRWGDFLRHMGLLAPCRKCNRGAYAWAQIYHIMAQIDARHCPHHPKGGAAKPHLPDLIHRLLPQGRRLSVPRRHRPLAKKLRPRAPYPIHRERMRGLIRWRKDALLRKYIGSGETVRSLRNPSIAPKEIAREDGEQIRP